MPIEKERIEYFIRQSDVIDNRLNGLRRQRFTSPHVGKLVRDALAIATVLRAQLVDYRAIAVPLPTDDDRITHVINAIILLRDNVLTALAEAPLGERPSTLMAELERFLSTALGQPVTVLAAPCDGLNYFVRDVWRGVNHYLTLLRLPDPVAAQNRRFVRVLYPQAEPDNISLGAILAHEGGHIIITQYQLDATLIAEMMADIAIQALFNKVEPQAAFRALPPPYQDLIVRRLLTRSGASYDSTGILMNWSRELLADAVGLVTLGPAAAFAAADIVNAHNMAGTEAWGRTHPRMRFRIELQEHYLAGDFDAALDPYTESVRYLGETNARLSSATEDPIPLLEVQPTAAGSFRLDCDSDFYLALETALRNKFDRIIQLARDTLQPLGLAYEPAQFTRDVRALVDALCRCQKPPRTSSMPSLVNAVAIVTHGAIADLLVARPKLNTLESEKPGAGRFAGERTVTDLVHAVLRDRNGLKEALHVRVVRCVRRLI